MLAQRLRRWVNISPALGQRLVFGGIVLLICGTKWVFKHQDLQMRCLKLNKYENFHTLEVVDRGSETRLQVGEKFNYLI